MKKVSHDIKVITDRLLRSWVRCRRKAWLDRYGAQEQRLWTPHRTLQLDHQQRSFVAFMPQKPGRGIGACITGKHGVIGLRLKGLGPSGQLLESHPSLLERIQGKSIWGDFSYRPVLGRQGRRVTREHRLSLAINGLLLEHLQGAKVSEGLAICKTKTHLTIEHINLEKDRIQKELKDSLHKLEEDLRFKDPPPITSDRRKCVICSWRGVCNAEAIAEGHLSEVCGIGASRRKILHELGINSLDSLAGFDPETLKKSLRVYGEQHSDIAHQIISQAKAQKNGNIERLDPTKALPELIKAPGVLIYDIESDPDAREDFLHGFVRVEKKLSGGWDLKGAKYHPILLLFEHREKYSWERIKCKMKKYQNWPILHYGETEVLSIYKMAERQGESKEQLKLLQNRFIDIHARLRKHWRIPLNSYGLKSVAQWSGFKWSQPGADGAKALLWWRQWRDAEHQSWSRSNSLRWILQYNQDDCLATWKVAEWLFEQDQNHS